MSKNGDAGSVAGSVKGKEEAPKKEDKQVAKPKGIKISPPEPFYGDSAKLPAFLTQCMLNFEFYKGDFEAQSSPGRAKVLFACSFLRGRANDWMEPHLTAYASKGWVNSLGQDVLNLLGDWTNFVKELKNMYGDPQEAKTAMSKLGRIAQGNQTAAQYTSQYKGLMHRTKWGEEAHMSRYYEGLSKEIKDRISIGDHDPTTFKELTNLAIQLDDRIRRRRMEDKGTYEWGSQGNARKQYRKDPNAMDWEATNAERKPWNKKNRKGDKKSWKSSRKPSQEFSGECFHCGKKGHRKADCYQLKQASNGERAKPKTQKREKTKQVATAEREGPNHASMSWTACYDDDCMIHMSEKDGSGHYPSRHQEPLILDGAVGDIESIGEDQLYLEDQMEQQFPYEYSPDYAGSEPESEQTIEERRNYNEDVTRARIQALEPRTSPPPPYCGDPTHQQLREESRIRKETIQGLQSVVTALTKELENTTKIKDGAEKTGKWLEGAYQDAHKELERLQRKLCVMEQLKNDTPGQCSWCKGKATYADKATQTDISITLREVTEIQERVQQQRKHHPKGDGRTEH
jgi:hypothetical protein